VLRSRNWLPEKQDLLILALHAFIIIGRRTSDSRHPVETSTVCVRYEVFTAVTMKNAVFWDVAPCRYCVNRRFRGTYRLLLPVHAGSSLADFSTLKMEALHSSEMMVYTRSTRRHIPEEGILQYCLVLQMSVVSRLSKSTGTEPCARTYNGEHH
jgi:hypothetical protein